MVYGLLPSYLLKPHQAYARKHHYAGRKPNAEPHFAASFAHLLKLHLILYKDCIFFCFKTARILAHLPLAVNIVFRIIIHCFSKSSRENRQNPFVRFHREEIPPFFRSDRRRAFPFNNLLRTERSPSLPYAIDAFNFRLFRLTDGRCDTGASTCRTSCGRSGQGSQSCDSHQVSQFQKSANSSS